MKVKNFQLNERSEVPALVAEIRKLQNLAAACSIEVKEMLESIAEGGDAAVCKLIEKFDKISTEPGDLRVDVREITLALDNCDQKLRRSLDIAAENIKSVAEAQLSNDYSVVLEHGQVIKQITQPIRRVGVYVPGGRGAYPSTVLMACIPAQVAKVQEVAICTPCDSDGKVDQLVLAACALSGVSEVYRIGGVQAIAAMAFGTESVKAVDLIVGPGNQYVREAKRQLLGHVGIDSLAGPSELMVVVDSSANHRLVALDLLAQSEHGPDSLLVLAGVRRQLLDEIVEEAATLASERKSVTETPLAVIETASLDAAIALAEELAPEHLELMCEEADQLANQVTRAGCIFVGSNGATAFGDYIVGSNHILPTGGAARFSSAVSVSTFQRRQACVSLSDEAVDALGPHVGRLANSEGFPVHGESAEIRSEKKVKS